MAKWFSDKLIDWYKKNKRDLPWRHEKDPYKIWLSEIILQQTQVKQGLNYYLRFCEKFPNVKSLAAASEDDVLKLWQGLGYYSRARNLHETAKNITEKYNGQFPKKYAEIRVLKGIGDYTAAAISSFAFNQPHAVVDGNVYRVLSRVFGIELAIDGSEGKKAFQNLANELLDKLQPARYNQAIMEFGSQYCKPKQSNCEACTFSNKCYAKREGLVNHFPVKSKKTKVSNRFLSYLVIADRAGQILINKRKEQDIWKGLYEFTLIETSQEYNFEDLLHAPEFKALKLNKAQLLLRSKSYQHILTHQKLRARFYVLRLSSKFKKNQKKIDVKQLDTLAFPRLIEKFVNDCDLKELL